MKQEEEMGWCDGPMVTHKHTGQMDYVDGQRNWKERMGQRWRGRPLTLIDPSLTSGGSNTHTHTSTFTGLEIFFLTGE